MKLDDTTEILSISIIDINRGTEARLFEREGSRCHFNEIFRFQEYFIQLRLDWDDLNNGEPMLDADIWTEKCGKKDFLKKGPWHHTKKKFDNVLGETIYTFEFGNLKLYLKTKKSISKDIHSKIVIRDSVSIVKNDEIVS